VSGGAGRPDLSRRLAAEAVGSALLLATVVGSGIMGERLAGGNVAVALLANTLATGAVLVALILTFGPISGAHFNPAVTLADASQGGLPWRDVPAMSRSRSRAPSPAWRPRT
jgi:glycerol uptake facilitator-like aquaporin